MKQSLYLDRNFSVFATPQFDVVRMSRHFNSLHRRSAWHQGILKEPCLFVETWKWIQWYCLLEIYL